ncbi:MAG: hypothetical protein NT018_07535 [Armatimonadetes bacterium]|nr:hypothetical protein [Armatimonadota bacterium]
MKMIRSLLKMCSRRVYQVNPLDQRLVISSTIINETLELLCSYRDKLGAHEGVVYWAGLFVPGCTVVVCVIAPEAITTAGSFTIGPQANARAISAAVRHGWRIVAQVHSHPSSKVDHSIGDDQEAFLPYPGYLSIVVPDYAMIPASSVAKWGFHAYCASGFQRLSSSSLQQQLLVIPDGPTNIDLREVTTR